MILLVCSLQTSQPACGRLLRRIWIQMDMVVCHLIIRVSAFGSIHTNQSS